MQRTWTSAASKYNRTASQKGVLSKIFNSLDWRSPTGEFAMMPAMAIEAAVKELRIPKVSAVATNGIYMDRYGVYGIEGNFKNGRARIYILDKGAGISVLASDFFPKEEEARSNPDDLTVPNTILKQMGGLGRIRTMIGAYDFMGDRNSLIFKWRGKSKNLANAIQITLMPSDTYKVQFSRLHGHSITSRGSFDDIYADQLIRLFESETGLYLRF